jgi:hypothetical protein
MTAETLRKWVRRAAVTAADGRDHDGRAQADQRARARARELRRVAAIRAFIDAYNNRCLFVWTKTADEILPRATRQPTSDARHQLRVQHP